MPQAGWIVDGEQYTHEELRAKLEAYEVDLPFTPTMLDQMFVWKERDYMSPTAFASCRRQKVLMREVPYWSDPFKKYKAWRGHLAHKMLEDEEGEPNGVREQQIGVNLTMPDGSSLQVLGTPDKILYFENGSWLLVDYKTVEDKLIDPTTERDREKFRSKVRGWTAQLSCYRWMLHKHGKSVDRAVIQMIAMTKPARVQIELWSLEDTERYIRSHVQRWKGVYDGTFNLDNLPPMLDPDFDRDIFWLCQVPGWCEVMSDCFQAREVELAQRRARLEDLFN